jgi:nucleoside-diphosphate-sugar epimerase
MRVFVTGASGHIASAVIPELLNAGHQVLGLVRSDDSAAAVAALGAEVRRGDLDDPQGLAQAAAESDGVIHLAFKHEAMRSGDFMGAVAADLAAVQAIGAALEGTDRPFVNTGGTLMLAMGGITGRPGTEEDVVSGGPRTEGANVTVALAQRGVRSSVVRLPPLVHSDLDHHGFTPTLIALAREQGHAAYVGDGANRWPAVHTRDAARLYRLALESAPPGSYLHPIGDEGIPFREIAQTIGAKLGVPAIGVTAKDAPEHLGFLAALAHLDNPTSSTLTRELLAWEPTQPGLIADLQDGHYFAS